jgi:pyruvate dehydrogenase E1 component alpha subunit
MGTAEWRSAKAPQYFRRGDYVPGLKVDGMDALAVKQGVAYAKAHCVAGKGPIVLEMDTYRYHGHSMSDPGSTYRTRDEITGVRQERDPVERLRKLVVQHELLSAAEIKALEKEQRALVDRAVAAAKACAEPPPEALFTDVYAAVVPPGLTARGVDARAHHPLL